MLFSCGDPRRFDPRVLIAVALDGDRVARDAPERLLGTGDGLVWTEVWSHSITHARARLMYGRRVVQVRLGELARDDVGHLYVHVVLR